MLKYRFNLKNMTTDMKHLDVSRVEFSGLHDEEEPNKILMVCHYDKDNELKEGDEIVVLGDFMLDYKPYPEKYSINERYEVCKVNDDLSLFTAIVDKYKALLPKSFRYTPLDGKEWLYMYFDEPHLFNEYIENITIVFRYNGNHVFMDESSEEFTYETDKMVVLEGCEWLNPNVLRYDVANLGDLWEYVRKILFKDDFNEADTTKITVLRPNVLTYNDFEYKIYQNKPLTTLNVGLSQNLDTNLLQNENISEHFVEYEKERSINPIVEMEKNIFHPVIVKKSANLNKIDGKYDDVYEIELNLHLRPHKGEDWAVDDNDYWNGVQVKDGKPEFIDDFFSFTDKSRQSDLLGYLDFNNGDIKFQKNKLKKSFLRLSFYDSDKPYKQNLLSYSTVYLDCGNLFNKYVKHIDENTFSQIIYEEDEVTQAKEGLLEELTGLRVNREPMAVMYKNDDEAEDCRLSSRFVIKDRYNSIRSSEGFYIYLWKESTDGVVPQDLYLKVELNHAGYGRTLPFMMPYKDDGGGIKTFDDILEDWTPDGDNAVGYGIRRYMRYSYIHFKYCHDKATNKGIYYLDPEQYGESTYFENNKIVLNLYEAKISNN